MEVLQESFPRMESWSQIVFREIGGEVALK
jgi:hypothetical protein